MHDPADGAAIGEFNPDNRAWHRLGAVADEHFDRSDWTREDGRPVMLTLTDLDSGDMITLAVIDSLENRHPYVLLAVSADGAMCAYGPFDGDVAASGYAPRLAAADPTIVATCPAPLNPADQPVLPETGWLALPQQVAASAHPPPGQPGPAVVVLLDRARAIAATVGPFDDRSAAGAWAPTPEIDPALDRLVIGLQPPPAPDTPG
jgi:hypothetical protein